MNSVPKQPSSLETSSIFEPALESMILSQHRHHSLPQEGAVLWLPCRLRSGLQDSTPLHTVEAVGASPQQSFVSPCKLLCGKFKLVWLLGKSGPAQGMAMRLATRLWHQARCNASHRLSREVAGACSCRMILPSALYQYRTRMLLVASSWFSSQVPARIICESTGAHALVDTPCPQPRLSALGPSKSWLNK
jgi:hypothetical protein